MAAKKKAAAKKKTAKKGTVPPALKAWNKHVRETRKENPKLSFKQALKLASKTY